MRGWLAGASGVICLAFITTHYTPQAPYLTLQRVTLHTGYNIPLYILRSTLPRFEPCYNMALHSCIITVSQNIDCATLIWWLYLVVYRTQYTTPTHYTTQHAPCQRCLIFNMWCNVLSVLSCTYTMNLPLCQMCGMIGGRGYPRFF